MATQYTEVRNDYVDDQNVTSIDGYKTCDGDEQGTTIAFVCNDTGKVLFTDNRERMNPQIREAIVEVLMEIRPTIQIQFLKYLDDSISLFK